MSRHASADLLDRIQNEIRQRIVELKPIVEEHGRLLAAKNALESTQTPVTTPRKRAARRKALGRAPRGVNRDAIRSTIEERPGITRPEIAVVTGVAKPTVYATVRAMLQQGALVTEELPSGQTGFRLPG